MDTKLRALVDTVVSTARSILETGEELTPMFHVGRFTGNNPSISIVATPFNGENFIAVKENAARAVKLIAAKEGAEFIVFTSEAWTLPRDATQEYMEELEQGKYPEGIQGHPKRIEVVVFTVETHEASYIAHCPILRDGKAGRINPPEFKQGGHAGRFSGLLPGKVRGAPITKGDVFHDIGGD